MKLKAVNRNWLNALGWALHDGSDRLIRCLQEIRSDGNEQLQDSFNRRQRQPTAGLRGALPIAAFRSVDVTINAIPREGTPDVILTRIGRLGRLWRHDMGRLLTHPDLPSFDAIGVYLTGSKISDFRLALDLCPKANDHCCSADSTGWFWRNFSRA